MRPCMSMGSHCDCFDAIHWPLGRLRDAAGLSEFSCKQERHELEMSAPAT